MVQKFDCWKCRKTRGSISSIDCQLVFSLGSIKDYRHTSWLPNHSLELPHHNLLSVYTGCYRKRLQPFQESRVDNSLLTVNLCLDVQTSLGSHVWRLIRVKNFEKCPFKFAIQKNFQTKRPYSDSRKNFATFERHISLYYILDDYHVFNQWGRKWTSCTVKNY